MRSTGVTLPTVQTSKTPLDYVSCIRESFKRISMGSSYYRSFLLLHKPRGTVTYKTKVEKRLGVTLKQSYVNRRTTMLYLGMIPPGNSNIVHSRKQGQVQRFGRGKIKAGMVTTNNAAK